MELALPITVYWDLASEAPFDARLPLFCNEIMECRPLMLQLYDPSFKLSEASYKILEQFKGSQIAVILTLPASSFKFVSCRAKAEIGVKELLIACDNLESLSEFHSISDAGLSFFVNHKNWRDLPEVVTFCRNNGINRLVLPMQRLFSSKDAFFINKNQQKELEVSLADAGGVSDLQLTIHDPFLWRAFNPEIPFPQGGCQAANTMISISPDGAVYPCPTMPERIGVIGEGASLKEIITSTAKKELRRRIIAPPLACNSCQEILVCKGGCRGRSLIIHESFDGIDDACR